MAKLEIVVSVETDDAAADFEYLMQLQTAIIAVTDLHRWGFTADEILCTTSVDSEVPVAPTKLFNHEVD